MRVGECRFAGEGSPLSEIGRTDDVCPSCLAQLERRPKRKTACPACGADIFVRTRLVDGASVLVDDAGRREIEAQRRARAWIEKPFTPEETEAQRTHLARHRDATLKSARSAIDLGIDLSLIILAAPHACPVALAQSGRLYTPDELPPLPMPDCSLNPKCSCCYSTEIAESSPRKSTGEVDREYDEALAGLDPQSARQINSMVESAIRGFGIEPKPNRWSEASPDKSASRPTASAQRPNSPPSSLADPGQPCPLPARSRGDRTLLGWLRRLFK